MPSNENILQKNVGKHFAANQHDGHAHAAIASLRSAAVERVVTAGFPTTRQEEWRFTNVTPIVTTDFSPALKAADVSQAAHALDRYLVAGEGAAVLVYVNGFYSPELSVLPAGPLKGITIGPLTEHLKRPNSSAEPLLGRLVPHEDNAFVALNTAFFTDGLFVEVPAGVQVDIPLQIVHLTLAGDLPHASYPRILMNLAEGSRLTVVEIHGAVQGGVSLSAPVTEAFVGTGAALDYVKLVVEDERAFHVGTTAVRQEQGSILTSNVLTLSGALVRNAVTTRLNGSKALCTMNGLSVAGGRQLVDNHTMINHAVPDCESHELYKAILDDHAHGVFSGRVMVAQDAQKTNAKQTNKTLLLSPDAVMNAKPQLEIFADDVKCTHGATVGQIDDEQLLYLRTRGIGVREATEMLTGAFASDVVARIPQVSLREGLGRLLQDRLQRRIKRT